MARSHVRVVVDPAAVGALLKSREVLAELERHGRPMLAAAGPGHEMESSIGPNRARVTVRTVTLEAMRAEATERRLTRAIDAGRG